MVFPVHTAATFGTRRWETPALIDATWQGQPRKLLVQANRNGFFYVLDRANGQFLLGTNTDKNVTWASGSPRKGVRLEADMEPTPEGRRVCPSLEGASNWYSRRTTRQPACITCRRTTSAASSRKSRWSGQPAAATWAARSCRRPQSLLDGCCGQSTFRRKSGMEVPQIGPVTSWGGTLSRHRERCGLLWRR